MQVSITSASRPSLRKPGDELLVSGLLFLRKRNCNTHATARFDALYEAIDLYRLFQQNFCGKTGAHPQRIDRFDEHSVGTDVAGVGTQNRRTPFNIEAGAKIEARRPPTFKPASRQMCIAHEAGESPCSGSLATAHGL